MDENTIDRLVDEIEKSANVEEALGCIARLEAIGLDKASWDEFMKIVRAVNRKDQQEKANVRRNQPPA
jgi:hypothetical protein